MAPSLLRPLAGPRPNQGGARDITYVPMARGFVYRRAGRDWFSRQVRAGRRSLTLETGPGGAALSAALVRQGTPESMNPDQGRQFPAVAFLPALPDAQIAIRMDGKGAWRDHVVGERLWRTSKYEEVYLRAYRSVSEARSGLDRYLEFYNRCSPHSSLGGRPPDPVAFNQPTPIPAAA